MASLFKKKDKGDSNKKKSSDSGKPDRKLTPSSQNDLKSSQPSSGGLVGRGSLLPRGAAAAQAGRPKVSFADAAAPPQIFGANGATFEVLLKYEREKHPDLCIEVPLVISRCLDFLMYRGLNAEGLFRVPGAKDTLDYYIGEFNAGRGYEIDFLKKDELPENVASLLKQYLREMPDIPLFTKTLGDEFCALPTIVDENERVTKYWELLVQIPKVNQVVIKKLLFYLMQVSSNASTNKMSTDALSIVFGQMAGVFADKAYELVKWLIDKYPIVYEKADCAAADSPLFLRKLVGHSRSVIKLVREGDYVFSFDSNGGVRIWDAINFQYFRTFETGIKHSKPAILHGKIYSLEQQTQQLKVWTLADVLDPNNDKPQPEIIKLESHCSSFCVAIRNELWIGGDGILVLSEDGTFTSLGEKNQRTLYCTFTEVDDTVWALQGKKILIWDIASKELKHELTDKFPKGNPQNILTIGHNLWISGRIAAKGAIWVMNANTFEVEAELTKHNSEVYMCQDIGDLVWSVSWDKMIYTWRPEDHLFVAQIKNFHTDAIQAIFSVPRKEGDGWIVWTASSDSTINVLFVPNNYSEALISQAKLASLPKSHSKPLLSPILVQEPHPTKLSVDARSNLKKSSPREELSAEDPSQDSSTPLASPKLVVPNDPEEDSSSEPKHSTSGNLRASAPGSRTRDTSTSDKRKQKKEPRGPPIRRKSLGADTSAVSPGGDRSLESSEAAEDIPESTDYLAGAALLLAPPSDYEEPTQSQAHQATTETNETQQTENPVKEPLSLRGLFHQPEPSTDPEADPSNREEQDMSLAGKEESDSGPAQDVNED